jgi:hypothetical protein
MGEQEKEKERESNVAEVQKSQMGVLESIKEHFSVISGV